MKHSKIVLVADWITITGGAEKVIENFHKLYPEAPIYTSFCSDTWRTRLDNKVVTGYLQHWPFSAARRFLPLLRQWWFRSLDLSSYDTIISITGNGEAKFVRKNSNQVHLCYCHTPPHFYWAQYESYLEHPSMRPYWLARLGLRLLVKPLRKRDYAAAQHVDAFMANSSAIQADIKKYYGRTSTIVFPPVDVEHFIQIAPRSEKRTTPKTPHCIWWGRIVPAKRLDIAIEACEALGWPLTIIGSGPDTNRLKRLAGSSTAFTGFVSDEERDRLIASADLYIFPSFEDFGVAPVEALAAGLPVIAYGAGGALDYIEPGKNGLLFTPQTFESLLDSLRSTPGKSWQNMAHRVDKKFGIRRFQSDINAFVKSNQPVQEDVA